MNQLCKVCGEPAAGYHFGTLTCEGCKIEMVSQSSQESASLLPLSQETFMSVWNGIPQILKDVMLTDKGGNLVANELINSSQESIAENSANFPMSAVPVEPVNGLANLRSSLPSLDNFPGFFNFSVTVPPQNVMNKSSNYLYSSTLERLYMKRSMFCPFYFSVSADGFQIEGFHVRAMLYFSSPENLNDPVCRCYNHSSLDERAGDPYFEHLLISNNAHAEYFKDEVTNRCSVLVPFENQQMGQTCYLYKLQCWTSCSGGPNRRPMCIVFTLEHGGLMMGRCKIDVKSCSTPLRDKVADEKKLSGIQDENGEDSLQQISAIARAAPSLSDITNERKPPKESPAKRKCDEMSGDKKVYSVQIKLLWRD